MKKSTFRLFALFLFSFFAINSYAQLNATITLDSNVSCNGFLDGGATAIATGGTTPYTYSWSNTATTASITGVGAGSYSVVVTDALGATSSASVSITEPSALFAGTTGIINPLCNGDASGEITASASAGTPPYQYLWSNGQTTATITGLTATTYTVTVTDDNGCTQSASVTLTQPNTLTVTAANPGNPSCSGTSDGAATAVPTGGTSPYTYLWSNSVTTAGLSGVPAGTYTVVVTDANGCTASDNVTLSNPSNVSVTAVVDSTVSCNGLADGGLSSTVTGGAQPYSYSWNNGATTSSITGVVAGTYTIVVTDNNGCTGDASNTVTEPAALVAATVADSNVSCNGLSDGGGTASATGGTMPYTYAWSNSATTASISGVSAGVYSVTITDANGCSDTASLIISEPTTLVAQSTLDSNATCNGLSDGGASSMATGGTAPYTYLWSNTATTASITGVPAGTYTVTITDNNGCSDTSVVTINEPALLVASIATDSNISCNGLTDGGATASATGGTMPYTYAWSNSATTASITGLAPATYDVTITDANGCSDVSSATITEPVVFVSNAVLDSNLSCFAAMDGGATTSGIGGTTPYNYSWSNSATTASITGVAAGTYSVTVTDANGCTDSSSVTITEPNQLFGGVVSPVNPLCFGDSTGSLTAQAGGGSPLYSFEWNTGATTAVLTGVPAGTYTVSVTDASGCVVTANGTLTQPTQVTKTLSNLNDPTCFGSSDASGLVIPTGGVAPYTYVWSEGTTIATIAGVPSGTYIITVTDANGCSSSDSITFTDPLPIVASAVVDSNASCNGFADGGATASATGGTSPYTYAWSNSAITASITGVIVGDYFVTVTDANGCTSIDTATVTEPTQLLVGTTGATNIGCFGDSTGSVTAQAGGGTTPFSFAWSNGQTTAAISGLPAGTYTVTVTDGNGCTATASATLTQPSEITMPTVNVNYPTCFGGSDASGLVLATGGTTPYTYLWSNGSTASSITGVSAGTYTVTVTDANACTSSDSITFTDPLPLITSTVVDSAVSCNGLADGGVTASTINGALPYSYSWSNGMTGASITGVPAGTYSVTVTDVNGCTDSTSVVVTEPLVLASAVSVDSTVSCNGLSDGGATVGVTGGTMAYTYNWSNSATTASIIGVTAGTYSVTVTDANGCSDSSSVTITEPTILVSVAAVDSNVSCNGLADGGATVGTTGGTMPYSYAWSNSATTASISGVVAGTYSVTVTDVNGCSDSSSVTITEPVLLVATSVLDSNVSCSGFADGGAIASATGGTGMYMYSWSNGATTSSITGVVAGTYSVTITDANGCTDSASVTVTEPTTLVVAANVDNNVSCNGLSDGAVTASANGGTMPYGYNWSNGSTTASITGLAAGSYSVTITDGNGCTASITGVITEPAALVASTALDSNVSCNGGSDGSATASAMGGTMPYSYSWSNGDTTAATVTMAGTYSVTITDANGCTDSSSIVIAEPTLLVSSTMADSNVSCNGGMNGGATTSAVGGTMPYSYMWSNNATTASITGVMAGTYSVTVTDANGCSDSSSVVITEPMALVATLSVDSTISCNGLSNGGATVTATGGTGMYMYAWSNGATNASITGVMAGTYSVTVTDANGCTDSTSIAVTEPGVLVASAVIDNNVSCNGGSDGSATASAMGGTMPYTYNWSNSGTTANAAGLLPGTYTVTITDANGCSDIASVTITEPTALMSSVALNSNVTCNGGMDGSATVSAMGGTMPYSYTWSNGDLTATTTTVAGTHTVTVTDANGCTSVSSVTITQPTPIVALIPNVTNNQCFGDANGSLEAVATGGVPGYSYAWSDGQTTAIATGLAAGTYTVTVTDMSGCTMTNTGSVTEPNELLSTFTTVSNPACNGSSTGSVTAFATGGVSPYQYAWDSGTNVALNSGLAAGTHVVTITDANGCTLIDSITLIDPAVVAGTVSNSTDASCNGAADGSASIAATGGIAPYIYNWSNGVSGASASGLSAGTYTVTISDANNCTGTVSVVIGEPALLVASTAVNNNVSCNGGADGSATANATGGTSPYVYNWSNGTIGANASGLAAGTHTVSVSDANGCMTMTTVTITEPMALSFSLSSDTTTCSGDVDGMAFVTGVTGGTSPYTYTWNTGATGDTLSGVVAGTYTATVTDANGCTSVGSVDIFDRVPLDLLLVVNDAICEQGNDGSIEASVSGGNGGYSYAWSTGANTATVTNLADGGTYTVTITDAAGCTITGTEQVSFLNFLPVVDLGNDTAFGIPSLVTLNTGATGFHSWSTGATTDNLVFELLSDTTIWVVVETQAGCTASDTITIQGLLGVEGVGSAYTVKLFPNPTNGNLNIQLDDIRAEEVVIQVVDFAGKLIYNREWNRPSEQFMQTIDMSANSQGVYFVNIFIDGHRHTERVTVY